MGFTPDAMMVATDTIERILKQCSLFVSQLYECIDPYKRHHRFYVNAALVEIRHRKLVKEAKEQSSYSMNMFGNQGPIVMDDKPKLIDRSDLMDPEDTIKHIITLLKRNANQNPPGF